MGWHCKSLRCMTKRMLLHNLSKRSCHTSKNINLICAVNHFDLNVSEIIDVRTPEEYNADHIPGAVNLPVLSSEEHQYVGTLYKKDPLAARKLGASFISKNISEHLNVHFLDKKKEYKPLIYCKRGGQRSLSLVLILQQIGFESVQYTGGFKCYREQVRRKLLELPPLFDFRVVAGKTGCGKTYLLHKLQQSGHQTLDLEGLAKHKGSLLGLWDGCTQPTQRHFESLLVHTLMSLDTTKPVWVESESVKIGRIHVPSVLFHHICHSQHRFVIDLPLEERIKCIKRDYPHWRQDENKGELIRLLKHLVKIRGHEKVDSWTRMIDLGQWDCLVKDLLVEHYDPTYTCSQRKNNKSGGEINVSMDSQADDCIKETIEYLVTNNH